MNADFIIPVTIDSNDRLRNLFRSTIYLSSQFKDSKIYIVNQTVDSSDEIIANYIKLYNLENVVLYHYFIDAPCYKTKLINKGIDLSSKKVVFMYDCDVLIPKEQLELSAEFCNEKGYGLVYPYSNPQYNVEQNHIKDFQDDYDFITLQKTIEPFQIPHAHRRNSYPIIGYAPGFCLTLNKEILGKHIYYNEEFRSPQYEDSEYIFKMDFLGTKMTRIYGPVFHFQHERIIETRFPHVVQENRRIFERIVSMKYDELKNYYNKE